MDFSSYMSHLSLGRPRETLESTVDMSLHITGLQHLNRKCFAFYDDWFVSRIGDFPCVFLPNSPKSVVEYPKEKIKIGNGHLSIWGDSSYFVNASDPKK